jgi:hypothetical protein
MGSPEVLQPLGHVHLVQVVRPDPRAEERVVQLLEDASVGVHPSHQDRLVLHRDPVVDQPLAGIARLGGSAPSGG